MQKKKFLMQFLIFFCYELIVCPLIFKSNKVYFASSLIAKPTVQVLLSCSLEKAIFTHAQRVSVLRAIGIHICMF